MDDERAHGTVDLLRPGAWTEESGTTFCVEAPHAEEVSLCLFEPGEPVESARHPLTRADDRLHHWVHVPGVRPGAHYGYRVSGVFNPAAGLLFNPNKLLVDPWARALSRQGRYHPSHAVMAVGGTPDTRDSAPTMPRSVVVETGPALPDPAPPRPRTPMHESVIYECHVRGMTSHHPAIPEALRGTYLGLSHPTAIAHLKSLSVTTVSLMPVAESYDEAHLVQRGLHNYWGYAPLASFAPTHRYATQGGDPRREFREMVDALHAEGIEVLVDVVFNHTPEGDLYGTSLSLRGMDSRAFFAWTPEHPRQGIDHTGCGNSLDLSHPTCLRYVLDALRHWVTDLGVDGFRFDLAVTLARGPEGFSAHGPIAAAALQDPVLRDCKLVAEPWDVGPGGYRLGGFPAGFSEWNDRFRDAVRRAIRGDAGNTTELATRLSGSSDLFLSPGRGPSASVNFVTSHDGFTLRDLVTYAEKHNEANGEENRDGHNENLSANYGHEGETEDAAVQQLRDTAARSMVLCLAVAQGVPMLSHGDEIGRTQCGNNNAYCQDNALSHLDWTAPERHRTLGFVQRAMAFRKRHPCLRPLSHLHGGLVAGRPDLTWLSRDGETLADANWGGHTLAMRVCGDEGDGVLLLVNGGSEAARFRLPPADRGYGWRVRLDAASARAPLPRHPRVVDVAAHGAVALDMEKNT